MKLFNKITQLSEFEKEFKKLKKRFRTLDSDLENFIKVQLKIFHKLDIDNISLRLMSLWLKGIFEISGLGIKYPQIYKVTKFACKSLKGTGSRSGIRIIYAYYEKEDIIEFIEIYYKGDKENEDRERILKYFKE